VTWRRVLLAACLFALLGSASLRADDQRVVLVAWNLRNYSLNPAAAPSNEPPPPPKSRAAISAIVQTLAELKPDILGLCEIGSRADLADLQRRLKNAGVALPHATIVEGEDPHRHLALLSRFPLAPDAHLSRPTFQLGGLPHSVRRGFLDTTVQVRPDFSLRVLGAHLKSRRVVPDYDQAEFRRFEAQLLRHHLDHVLAGAPATPLVLFGDFNDTKNSPVIRTILGRKGAADSLTALALADSHGDQWTYHWTETDDYSRIDYLMVNRPLRPLVDRRASGIHRSASWRTASDHRPLVMVLKLPPST
jgi:endonuclease/exonuclease/phosphatase family metal-dependent hydrolase